MPKLELFFDYASPFGYLATVAAPQVAARHGVTLEWRPFLLGALFRDIGTPMVPVAEMSEAKRRYVLKDMHRWAELRGAPLVFPSRFPLRTLKPLRMTLAAEPEARAALIASLMRACWAEDLDPDDDDVLRACAERAGAPAALVEATGRADVKEQLRKNTDEAAARGVPGAPTFFVDDLMFWGQDRLDHVERALSGWRPKAG